MTTTPMLPTPATTGARAAGAPPSLPRRLGTTAAALVALVLVGALAVAAVSAGASPATDPVLTDHTDHAAMGSPPADDEPPPPPAPGEVVGVLDLFGRPMLGPDGQPLALPLRPPSPKRPPNADEVYVPDGQPLTEGVSEVDLLAAHATTLNEVANDEHYSLVQRFDLFRANGLVTAAPGVPDGDGWYRALLGQLDQQLANDQTAAGCSTSAAVLAQSDGVPTDLIAGLAVGQLHAEVLLTRQALGCP